MPRIKPRDAFGAPSVPAPAPARRTYRALPAYRALLAVDLAGFTVAIGDLGRSINEPFPNEDAATTTLLLAAARQPHGGPFVDALLAHPHIDVNGRTDTPLGEHMVLECINNEGRINGGARGEPTGLEQYINYAAVQVARHPDLDVFAHRRLVLTLSDWIETYNMELPGEYTAEAAQEEGEEGEPFYSPGLAAENYADMLRAGHTLLAVLRHPGLPRALQRIRESGARFGPGIAPNMLNAASGESFDAVVETALDTLDDAVQQRRRFYEQFPTAAAAAGSPWGETWSAEDREATEHMTAAAPVAAAAPLWAPARRAAAPGSPGA